MSEVTDIIDELFSYKKTLVDLLLELATFRVLLPSEIQCTDFEVFHDDIEYFKDTVDEVQRELNEFKAMESVKRKLVDRSNSSGEKQLRAEMPLDSDTVKQNSVIEVEGVSSSVAVGGCTDNETSGTSKRSSCQTGIASENKKSPDEPQTIDHKCGKCTVQYGSKEELTKHEENSHSIFRCPFCDTVFRFDSHRMRHLTIHTENKIYCCHFCSAQHVLKNDFVKHLNKHKDEKNYEAELQKAKDADVNDLIWKSINKIDQTASSMLFLGDLDESITKEALVSEFQSFGKILLINLVSLPEAPGMKLGFIQFETKEIGCQVRRYKNGKDFMGRKLLISYCKSDNQFLNIMSISQKGGSTVYECSLCNFSDKPFTLKRHFQKHTGYRPVQCNLCGKDFFTNGQILAHKRKVHKVFDKDDEDGQSGKGHQRKKARTK